jgi:hypothetical protein
MLAKCANPSCSASFLRLQDGRLFLLETDLTPRSSKAKAGEYFWLCKGCSAGMTLRLAQDGGVAATGLRQVLRAGPASLSPRQTVRMGDSFALSAFFAEAAREAHENPGTGTPCHMTGNSTMT